MAHRKSEAELFDHFPKQLKDMLYYDAREPLLGTYFMVSCRESGSAQFFMDMCCEVLKEEIVFAGELAFSEGAKCTNMFVIQSGKLVYCGFYASESNLTHVPSGNAPLWRLFAAVAPPTTDANFDMPVKAGDCLAEACLWTSWHHRGTLMAHANSFVLIADKVRFCQAVTPHPEICKLALLCARQCVAELNQEYVIRTDMHTYKGEQDDENAYRDDSRIHLIFLSHYKLEAGTEATLMMEELTRMIKADLFHHASLYEHPIFIDSEALTDLTQLSDAVTKSHYIVPLLTPGFLLRPWCLVEVVTAYRNGVEILPVDVQRPGMKFEYPNEEFYEKLRTSNLLDDKAMAVLKSQAIETSDLEAAIRAIFKKIAKPFSPHKSGKVRQAELADLLRLCPYRKGTSVIA